MKLKYTLFTCALIAFAFFNSCTEDPVIEDPIPDPDLVVDCDTIDATYNTTVKLIINENCATDYCHGGAGSGNVYMKGYTESKTVGLGDKFLKVIRHEDGVSAMPKNKPKLSDADIAVLECWVEKGAPE